MDSKKEEIFKEMMFDRNYTFFKTVETNELWYDGSDLIFVYKSPIPCIKKETIIHLITTSEHFKPKTILAFYQNNITTAVKNTIFDSKNEKKSHVNIELLCENLFDCNFTKHNFQPSFRIFPHKISQNKIEELPRILESDKIVKWYGFKKNTILLICPSKCDDSKIGPNGLCCNNCHIRVVF